MDRKRFTGMDLAKFGMPAGGADDHSDIERRVRAFEPFKLNDGAELRIAAIEEFPALDRVVVTIQQRKPDAVSRIIMGGYPVGRTYTQIDAQVELGALCAALARNLA